MNRDRQDGQDGVVRDEMKSLSEEDKGWLFCKSVLRLWPFR